MGGPTWVSRRTRSWRCPTRWTVPVPDLTVVEAKRLTALAREKHDQFCALLLVLHERRGYRAMGYRNWSEYVAKELEVRRSRTYQLLEHAKVLRRIEEAFGERVRSSEKSAREVTAHTAEVIRRARVDVKKGSTVQAAVNDAVWVVRTRLDDERSKAKAARDAERKRMVASAGGSPPGLADTEDVDAEDVDTEDVDTEDVDTEDVDTEDVDTEDVDTEDVDTEDVDTEDVDTEDVDTEDVDTEDVDAEDVDTEDVDTEDVNAEDVDTEDVDTRSSLERFQEVVVSIPDDDLEKCHTWFDDYCADHGGGWWLHR